LQNALTGGAGDHSLTLSAGTGTLTAADASALNPETANGKLTLTGTVDALNSYLASGDLSVSNGAGQSLSLALQQGSTAEVAGTVNLIALAPALPTLSLPATLFVLPGSSSPLVLGGTPITGDGTFTLTLSAEGSLSATSTTLDGNDASTHATGSSITLTGTASELNTYLSSGLLRFVGSADTLVMQLQRSVDNGQGVEARVSVAAISAPTQITAPTLTLPASFTALATDGQLTWGADALGSGGDVGGADMPDRSGRSPPACSSCSTMVLRALRRKVDVVRSDDISATETGPGGAMS
jgi:hypothetical protein